ncbi:MAG: TIR domain-containing protein [Ruminococcaceae bacterium]|nr:TIR domain-containing protein [Oscillospiraceae bacterium]
MSENKMNANIVNIGLPSYEGDEPYIFVSYSHVDSVMVREVLQRIDREKFRFWYDDTMEIGEDFRQELQDKVQRCHAFLLFVSPASMQSKYCGMEIITAFKHNKRIYPVYLDDNTEIPGALKLILENLQHVKGGSIQKDTRYLDKLIASLPPETMRSLQIDTDVLLRCKDGSNRLTVPDGVRVIGAGAFKNCEKLEKLDVGNTTEIMMAEACRGCKRLEGFVLPKNVRSVGESAFRDCTSLRFVIVENEEIELGERAFENCAALQDVQLADGISEIYGGVFNSCKSLESIRLPRELTVLGESSFADCVSLKKIDIPRSVTKIDDMVFNGCIALERVDMKDKITKIGKYAFKDCKSLKKIFLPRSVNFIGVGPFRGCTNLVEIEVDPKSRYFKAVDNVLFNKNKSVLYAFPPQMPQSSYAIPDSVTVVSAWAFCDCRNLEEVIIPDSVTEIGEGAFYQCESLHCVVIPDSVDKIDDTAFRGCSNLERVEIPDSVLDFGWGIFNGCDKIHVICSDSSAAARYCDKKNIPHSDK